MHPSRPSESFLPTAPPAGCYLLPHRFLGQAAASPAFKSGGRQYARGCCLRGQVLSRAALWAHGPSSTPARAVAVACPIAIAALPRNTFPLGALFAFKSATHAVIWLLPALVPTVVVVARGSMAGGVIVSRKCPLSSACPGGLLVDPGLAGGRGQPPLGLRGGRRRRHRHQGGHLGTDGRPNVPLAGRLPRGRRFFGNKRL